ncbi:MAG: FUSC family protein [Lachnospiraceae bacterium]|nr:FUSC family protein [Lachnospiraceae bacterium]
MHRKWPKVHVGKRTLKTAAAVILAMAIVDFYGATSSKLIFAMLGAMAVIQPTFRESLEACLSQIVGVLFGALVGVLLLLLPVSHLVATGIGIVAVITLYNVLHIQFSPSLSCFIVVMLCTSPDVEPMSYAIGRIWDTAIGLLVGMLINTLVFPYDNSRQIHATAESIDKEVLDFLLDLFDGDEHLPEAGEMEHKLHVMAQQMEIFSNQKLVLHLKRQKEQLAVFRECEQKARQLLARMELLRQMGEPGVLNEENRELLKKCGALKQEECPEAKEGDITEHPEEMMPEEMMPEETDTEVTVPFTERDIVMNYHVRQILMVREELLAALRKDTK